MDASSAQSVNILETFNAYQYRIYKLDFCSYNFHMYRFSRSDKVDVYRFMSKHSSEHYVLLCHDPLSHLAIDASSCMKLMHTRTEVTQHNVTLCTLRNKCYCKSWNAQIDKSLRKIRHYQQNAECAAALLSFSTI